MERTRGRAGAARGAPHRCVQHHLFLGHDGRAQGHRAAALDALGAHAPGTIRRLRARQHHAHRHAPLFEHHAGVLLPQPGAGRRGGADGQVRRRRLPRARRAPWGDPHDARAGAVPADHGARAFRALRPVALPHEALDQLAFPRGAQARRARALAGRADRVLRHDRRGRHLRARGPRASRQAAYGRHARAGRGPAPHRRSGTRGATRRSRRDRRPLHGDDDRLSQPAPGDRAPSGSTRKGGATSAPAMSGASTRTASSCCSTGERT